MLIVILQNKHIAEKSISHGIQKTLLQKSYELLAGVQSYTVAFTSANRWFTWFELSLVYDKSDKHSTVYNSYNSEVVSTIIKCASIENIANMYSVAIELMYDINEATEKHMLCK